MCCLFVLISLPHSDEIAVIMWHGYSTSNASFGSCRSSPLSESLFSHCVCIPSAWLGRRFPGFGFLWLSIALLPRSSLKELNFFSDQGRTIILDTISITFAYPLHKCAEKFRLWGFALSLTLCVSACECLSNFVTHQTYIAQFASVFACVCVRAMCVPVLTSQGWGNSLMLWLVPTKPSQTRNDVHLSVPADFTV